MVPRKRSLIAIAGVVLALTYRWKTQGRGFNLQDMQITQLTDSGKAADVAISPDGRYVVYVLRDGEKQSLWVRQVATRSDVQVLAPNNVSFKGVTFSADGNYVYFVRSDKNNPNFSYLLMMPSLGGTPRQIVRDIDSPISFSPDGRQFAFQRGSPEAHAVELRIASADGSGERVLATISKASAGFTPGPAWSPDGPSVHVNQRWCDEPLGAATVWGRPSPGNALHLGIDFRLCLGAWRQPVICCAWRFVE